ncbi:Hpt domain-containing protein, partial [Desulfovibrio sp. OttesenSCG-928-A18]|nr:Hpt domain-containing protein [Desulfovibrio sp. OttesenSCG-928-A18]
MSQLPPSLPGIDVASGVQRVAGNEKLYLKLLRRVASDAPATREKLGLAVADGDTAAVRELAHSLKGAASNLSITDVASSSAALEQAAKNGDFEAVLVRLGDLEAALEEYVQIVA